jgi:polar amino acid transport system substrate-binding protein
VAVPRGEPYAVKDPSGKLTGQTVEVVRAVLKTLDSDEVEFAQLDLPDIMKALVSQSVDIAGGLYITNGRCQGLTWSVPDHRALTALAVPPGNPKGLKTYAEIISTGATVAVMRGLPEHAYAQTKIPAGQVKEFPTPVEMLQVVTAGQVDCAAFSDIGLRSLMKAGLATLDVTPGFVADGQDIPVGAFAFKRGTDKELMAAFDEELTRLQQSGEWLRLAQPFGFTAEHLPAAGANGQACAR